MSFAIGAALFILLSSRRGPWTAGNQTQMNALNQWSGLN
jgi:hypothetical protein